MQNSMQPFSFLPDEWYLSIYTFRTPDLNAEDSIIPVCALTHTCPSQSSPQAPVGKSGKRAHKVHFVEQVFILTVIGLDYIRHKNLFQSFLSSTITPGRSDSAVHSGRTLGIHVGLLPQGDLTTQ